MSANFSSPIPGRIAPWSRQRNLPGDKYGNLTLVSDLRTFKGKTKWHCLCDCGKPTVVSQTALRTEHTKTCGCVIGEPTPVGVRFGRLVVLSKASGVDERTHWKVLCDCGTETSVRAYRVKHGETRSCGCLVSDTNSTHRMSGTSTYRAWAHAKDRCVNAANPDWPDYGGRGVTFHSAWYNFANFFRDMGERPNGTSIDRINNEGGYEPGNCRWATNKEQSRNRRSNINVCYKGRTLCLLDAAKVANLKYDTVRARITRRGWSISRALESSDFSDPI